MHKRKLARALFATAPILLPWTALAQPKDGAATPSSTPVQQKQARADAGQKTLSGTPSTASRSSSTSKPSTAPSATTKEKPMLSLHIAGRVVAPDNKTVGDAIVYAAWQQNNGQQQSHKLVCNADGKFDATLSVPANTAAKSLCLTAFSPGKGICWQLTSLDKGNLQELKLPLLPGIMLEGRLLKSNGDPLANTAVRLQSLCSANFPFVSNQLFALPAEAVSMLKSVTTDAEGKFLLTGVPSQAYLTLAPAASLVMAAGSTRNVTTTNQARQNAGIFVTTSLGSLRVRVVDALTGKPLPAMRVGITAPSLKAHPQMAQPMTDSNGDYLFSEVRPGNCQIFAQNNNQVIQLEPVQVTPGGTAAVAEIRLRQNALHGRLTDASGKPAAHIPLKFSSADTNINHFSINGSLVIVDQFSTVSVANNILGEGFSGNGVFTFQNTNNGQFTSVHINGNNAFFTNQAIVTQITATTDAAGNFEVKNFPWSMRNVQISATQGNDQAEWHGAAADLGSALNLQMRSNALVRVTGRLVDPQRRPIANASCQALHWQSTPRFAWFATARAVRTDANGEFTIDGLERGESFSVITVGSSRHDISVLKNTTRQSAEIITTDFESPRFMACRTGDGRSAQSLGDVMVHPSDTSEEVMQSYGGGSPGDLPELPGVLVAPTGATLQAAQLALARWESAIRTGDVQTLHRLTAHVSPCWSPDKQEFLQRASLRGRTEPTGDTRQETVTNETVQKDAISHASTLKAPDNYTLRFVPRSAVSVLLQQAPASVRATLSEFRGGDEALSHNADWAFLIRPDGKEGSLAGVMHQEDGEWHVVVNSMLTSVQMFPFQSPTAINTLDNTLLKVPAPALDAKSQTLAQAAGRQYLQTWLSGDKEKLRLQTSSKALFVGENLQQFHQKLEKRADGGVCPLAANERVNLQLVTDLTLWEQQWLERVVGANQRMYLKDHPSNTAVFRYTAQGHDFLMLMQQYNADWHILEPALSL